MVPDPETCALEVRHLLLDRVPGDLRPNAAARSGLDVVRVVPDQMVVPPPLEHRQVSEHLEELWKRRELDAEPADRRRQRVQNLGAHVEPAVEEDELGDALGMEGGEAHADVGAERMPHDDGAVEAEAVEQRPEVGRVVGEAVAGRGLVAVSPAAEVVGDEAVAPAERVGDRVVRCEPVDRDDGRAATRPLVRGERDGVDRHLLHAAPPSRCPGGSACRGPSAPRRRTPPTGSTR